LFSNKQDGVDCFVNLLINNYDNIKLGSIHFVKYKERLSRVNGFCRINFVILESIWPYIGSGTLFRDEV